MAMSEQAVNGLENFVVVCDTPLNGAVVETAASAEAVPVEPSDVIPPEHLTMPLEEALANGAALLLPFRVAYYEGRITREEAIDQATLAMSQWFTGPDVRESVAACLKFIPEWVTGEEQTIAVAEPEQPPEAQGTATSLPPDEQRTLFIDTLIRDAYIGFPGVKPFISRNLSASKPAWIIAEETWYRRHLEQKSTEELGRLAAVVTRERATHQMTSTDEAIRKFVASVVVREGLRARNSLLSLTGDAFDTIMGRMLEMVGVENADVLLSRFNQAKQVLGISRAYEAYSSVIKELANKAGMRVTTGTTVDENGLTVTLTETVDPTKDYTYDEMLRVGVQLSAHYHTLRSGSDTAREAADKLRDESDRHAAEAKRLRALLAKREQEVADALARESAANRRPTAYLKEGEAQWVLRHSEHEDRFIGITEEGREMIAAGQPPRIFDYVPVIGMRKALKLTSLEECRVLMDWLLERRHFRRVDVGAAGERYGIFQMVLHDHGS